ncbi:MAG: PEP-CTERM sorting domain-containing protein [Chthoniobacterales bacterium]
MKTKHIQPSIKSLALGLVAAAALAAGNSAQADLSFTMTETGSGVTLTGSGSFNFGGSLSTSGAGFGSIVRPDLAFFDTGPLVTGHDYANDAIVSGPTSFGSGADTVATSGSGDTFGVRVQFLNDVYLPSGYTSGNALSGEAFWSGATLASLGVTPGTYNWNTSYGGVDDTITLNVVPEPSSAALIGFAALGYGLLRRRRVVNS